MQEVQDGCFWMPLEESGHNSSVVETAQVRLLVLLDVFVMKSWQKFFSDGGKDV